MKKKKLLNILAETSKIVAMEGDGLPSFWGFYEPTYPRGLEQTKEYHTEEERFEKRC